MCKPGSAMPSTGYASAAGTRRERAPLAFAARVALRVAHCALPQSCVLCGALCVNMSQQPMCRGCDAQYWNEPRLRCLRCAMPLTLGGTHPHRPGRYVCSPCATRRPPFDRTLALADYRPPLDRLALGLKFRGRLLVAKEFARGLAALAIDRLAPDAWPDLVAPVPLAHERLVERGFNQAWEIAKPLARALNVPADAALLRRTTHTVAQSRLDLDARKRNVGAAFRSMREVRGMHVALVDDVMTSGATLEAAARTLKTAGAREVTNFVALRTAKD
jgi:ComF family protein